MQNSLVKCDLWTVRGGGLKMKRMISFGMQNKSDILKDFCKMLCSESE